jgi:DNA-directed RNA polymerase subunit F
MITDPAKLKELVEELAELDLPTRRAYIAQIESAQGPESAEQIRTGLRTFWEQR